MSLAGLASLFCLFVMASGCAPEPRNVPCTNDGQCEKASDEFRYCLQSRCVECVGSASCGDGSTCVDGACVTACASDKACPQRHVCQGGVCERL